MADISKCQGKHTDWFGNKRDCSRKATHDDGTHCIFHAKVKNAAEFKHVLIQLVRQWIEEKQVVWDFSGFVFPGEIRVEDITPVRNEHGNPKFPLKVSFNNVKFNGNAVFVSADFSEYADFSNTIFRDFAWFTQAAFCGYARFNKSIFTNASWFEKVTFNKDIHFFGTEFRGNLFFRETLILGNSIFEKTLFGGQSNFEGVSFARLGDFNKCAIKGHVRWIWPGEGERADKLKRGKLRFYDLQIEKGSELDFTRNILQDDTELLFEECDMSRIRLQGTDCTRITFYANEWKRRNGRLIVGDENLEWEAGKRRLIWSSVRWDLIGKTYQQLSRRFREDFDHEKANDFDLGVFEMRRLCPPVRNRLTRWLWGNIEIDREWYCWRWPFRFILHLLKRYLSLTAFYRYVSLYSGSILVPALLLIAMTCGFGLLYNHTLYSSLSLDTYSLKGIIAALRIVSLNRKWLTDEIDHLALSDSDELIVTLIGIAQIVISAIIVTMLLFAVRRRFKH